MRKNYIPIEIDLESNKKDQDSEDSKLLNSELGLSIAEAASFSLKRSILQISTSGKYTYYILQYWELINTIQLFFAVCCIFNENWSAIFENRNKNNRLNIFDRTAITKMNSTISFNTSIQIYLLFFEALSLFIVLFIEIMRSLIKKLYLHRLIAIILCIISLMETSIKSVNFTPRLTPLAKPVIIVLISHAARKKCFQVW